MKPSHQPKQAVPSVSAWVLRRLGAVSEVHLNTGKKTDGLAWIEIRAGQGEAVLFDVLEERLVSEETARALSESRRDSAVQLLVATRRLAPRARALLRNAGISWIERETGRCRLYGPGLLVDVIIGPDPEAEPATVPHSQTAPPTLLRGKSGHVAEALLQREHGAPINLSELAMAIGLSRSLVSRVLARLTALGILAAHGQPPRKHWTLEDAGALLDRWADEERPEPEEVTGLTVWSRAPEDFLDKLASLGEMQLKYALGGVAAANLYAPTLTTAPLPNIWIPADVAAVQIAKRLGGEIVGSGANVRIQQTSGDIAMRLAHALPSTPVRRVGLTVISPHRAYVEARSSGGRGPEVAAALRRILSLTPASTSRADSAR